MRAMKKLDETQCSRYITFWAAAVSLQNGKVKREFLEEQLQVVMPKVKEENVPDFPDLYRKKCI